MGWKKFLYNFRGYSLKQEKKAYRLLFDFTSEELGIPPGSPGFMSFHEAYKKNLQGKQSAKSIWIVIQHFLEESETGFGLMYELGSMKKTESWDKKIKKDMGYSWTELQNLMKKFNRQNPKAEKILHGEPVERIVHVNPEKLIKQLERAQKQIDKNPDKVDEIISKHIYKKEEIIT